VRRRRALPAIALVGVLLAFGARAQSTAPVVPATATAPAAVASSPIAVLLDQARYWRQQGRGDLALSAARRALLLDPHNADALALAAELNAERGERSEAEADLARLREAHPDDPRIARATQALRVGPIDPAALAQARDLAQQGHAAEAVDRYRALFHGGPPPDTLAVEYNQVLAGTEGGWNAARGGWRNSSAAIHRIRADSSPTRNC
jgi:cellulose synthase operon protein C